jgi:hypothetical protein
VQAFMRVSLPVCKRKNLHPFVRVREHAVIRYCTHTCKIARKDPCVPTCVRESVHTCKHMYVQASMCVRVRVFKRPCV